MIPSKKYKWYIHMKMILIWLWCETYIMYSASAAKFVYVVFVSLKIEIFNHLCLPIFLVSDWPLDLQTPKKDWHFIKKKKCYFSSNVKFRVSKLQTHFLKGCNFFSCNTFSVLMLMFELIFGSLTFGHEGVKLLLGPFVRSKILWYAPNFQWVQDSLFPNGKHAFFQFVDKFLKFE